MKVEVELEMIEGLRADIRRKEDKIRDLETKLSKVSQEELEKKIYKLAFTLFNKYMRATFEALGFEYDNMERDQVIGFDSYFDREGRWYENPDELKVTLRAHITEWGRKAFLNIGVIPNFKVKEKSILDETD